MKKLFTLLALLTCFMGAKAVEIVDAEVDFSKYSDISEWGFPYGWGGSESARARLSIQDGCLHFESTEATDPSWDCQFFPIGMGNNAEVDVVYTLHYKIKGSVAQNISMLGFGQTPYGQFAVTTDWVEGTVDYVATSSDGNILMQCGDYVGTIDIAYMKITHEGKEERPVEWLELITDDGTPEGKWMGNADTPWGDLANTRFNDLEETNGRPNTTYVCAWSKEKGVNMNDDGGWDPFPASIEPDPADPSNNVFVCHGKVADTEGDASAWDNQFWIMSTKQLKVGSQYKFHFRYKASETATTNTQMHSAQPSDYLHYAVLGDVNFSTTWQDYDGVVTIPEPQNNRPIFSIAFNLNSQNKNAVDFYFDDLSIQEMKLDEGLFVAGSNTSTGLEYDYDNAIPFVYDEALEAYTATIGTAGKQDTWVNEVMISTVRGNDRAFKGATLKPSGTFIGEDNWGEYTEASNAKIKLAAGVWKIAVDTEGKQVNFIQVEGDEPVGPIEINPNPTEVVVHGLERDDLSDTFDNQTGERTGREEEGGTGETWDNQFFIVANRTLDAGEVTVISFKYKASVAGATSGTQLHGDPGAYLHWNAIGSFNFTEEWQDFETTLTVPSEGNGMKSIAFNMAEIKGACDYYIKDVVWKLEDNTESLINQTGADNFYVKEGAGTTPHIFGTDVDAISNVVADKANTSAAYNLAGQRVSNDYKGIVVKNGRKYIVK